MSKDESYENLMLRTQLMHECVYLFRELERVRNETITKMFPLKLEEPIIKHVRGFVALPQDEARMLYGFEGDEVAHIHKKVKKANV